MRQKLSSVLTILLVIAAAFVLIRGCGGPNLTKAKVAKIQQGMMYHQVVAILGKPTRVESGADPADMKKGLPGMGDSGLYVWENRSRIVMVGFVRGRVALIQTNLLR